MTNTEMTFIIGTGLGIFIGLVLSIIIIALLHALSKQEKQ